MWTHQRRTADPRKTGTNPSKPKYMNEPKDISSEVSRTYTFPGGDRVTIEAPKALILSENGHRVLDGANNGHYIPKGWIHLEWQPKPDAAWVVA